MTNNFYYFIVIEFRVVTTIDIFSTKLIKVIFHYIYRNIVKY